MPHPTYSSSDHQWVGATYVSIPKNLARQAEKRGVIRVPEDTKVTILEVVCILCRRPFDDVDGQPCEAAENRDHLIGGTPNERKKRKHPYHDCEATNCNLGPSVSSIVARTG